MSINNAEGFGPGAMDIPVDPTSPWTLPEHMSRNQVWTLPEDMPGYQDTHNHGNIAGGGSTQDAVVAEQPTSEEYPRNDSRVWIPPEDMTYGQAERLQLLSQLNALEVTAKTTLGLTSPTTKDQFAAQADSFMGRYYSPDPTLSETKEVLGSRRPSVWSRFSFLQKLFLKYKPEAEVTPVSTPDISEPRPEDTIQFGRENDPDDPAAREQSAVSALREFLQQNYVERVEAIRSETGPIPMPRSGVSDFLSAQSHREPLPVTLQPARKLADRASEAPTIKMMPVAEGAGALIVSAPRELVAATSGHNQTSVNHLHFGGEGSAVVTDLLGFTSTSERFDTRSFQVPEAVIKEALGPGVDDAIGRIFEEADTTPAPVVSSPEVSILPSNNIDHELPNNTTAVDPNADTLHLKPVALYGGEYKSNGSPDLAALVAKQIELEKTQAKRRLEGENS